MRLKCRNLLMGVVVEDTQLEVVASCDAPVLAGDEANATDGGVSDLERLDQRAGIVVIDVNSAIVETS